MLSELLFRYGRVRHPHGAVPHTRVAIVSEDPGAEACREKGVSERSLSLLQPPLEADESALHVEEHSLRTFHAPLLLSELSHPREAPIQIVTSHSMQAYPGTGRSPPHLAGCRRMTLRFPAATWRPAPPRGTVVRRESGGLDAARHTRADLGLSRAGQRLGLKEIGHRRHRYKAAGRVLQGRRRRDLGRSRRAAHSVGVCTGPPVRSLAGHAHRPGDHRRGRTRSHARLHGRVTSAQSASARNLGESGRPTARARRPSRTDPAEGEPRSERDRLGRCSCLRT